MNRHTIFFVLLLLMVRFANAAEDRRERVMNDRKDVQAIGNWIYNDLPQGFTEAARTRKPMPDRLRPRKAPTRMNVPVKIETWIRVGRKMRKTDSTA